MADLNALSVFAKVVEANGFSEAARRLKMPVSTVSRRIADLEAQLGVRLLERSTRNLRLTEVGAEIMAHALRTTDIAEAVESIVSDQRRSVAGLLRIAAPPSISDSLLAPMIAAFQASYPAVRIEVFVTDHRVDHIAEGIDLAFQTVAAAKESSLVAQTILTFRHQLVASPAYLARGPAPQTPRDLLGHRLLTFSHRKPQHVWRFVHANGTHEETIAFRAYLSMNDFAGLTPALLAGAGIGNLPPVVQPELMREGRLVEVMPDWRFRTFDLALVHLKGRHMPRPLRMFKDFAAEMAPKLFPALPA